ncbi:MAG: LamG-like jellyroll fold domain-containing protein [Minisyncoccia bacterium]
MYINIKKVKKGFTLLEILLVIAAIGILAAIVLVAINPTRQISQVRNAQRRSDINAIYKALEQYLIDNKDYPEGITGTPKAICNNTVTTNCVNLSILVPTYLASIPKDPSGGVYNVYKNSANNRIGVEAPASELGQNVSVNIIITSPIIQNELVLHLDAGDVDSYPGTGNTWTDLSGNGNNGTIYNASYDSNDGGGSLVFNGINTRVDIPENSIWGLANSATFNVWYKASSYSGNIVGYMKGLWPGYEISPGLVVYSAQFGSNDLNGNYLYTLGDWVMITWVINRTTNEYIIYRNADQTGNPTPITHPSLPSSKLYLGARGDNLDRFMTGKIANVQFYNKVLTSTEIQQNYNAMKSRFGL